MRRVALSMILASAGALIAGCGERPPIQTIQSGYRGTGMEQNINPRLVAGQDVSNVVPPAPPPASHDGPKASEVYQNVKVLGDLSVGEFARNMVSITSWVAPEQGCTYCHNAANFADDGKYQKVVARSMLRMTQHINQDWKQHVAETGVTCYTCHRGYNIPAQLWYEPLAPKNQSTMAGNKAGQNLPSTIAGLSSLPNDPLTPLLSGPDAIRVVGKSALPDGNRHSIKQTEWTYALMMHMSKSLGVNCTYCHNSRSFQSWELSSPTRVTAYYGIRLANDLNQGYLIPLTNTFPQTRLGSNGDVGKVSCATCHQGAYKPLYGAKMLPDHPELARKSGELAAATPAASTPVAN